MFFYGYKDKKKYFSTDGRRWTQMDADERKKMLFLKICAHLLIFKIIILLLSDTVFTRLLLYKITELRANRA